jgi:hypothetical protein
MEKPTLTNKEDNTTCTDHEFADSGPREIMKVIRQNTTIQAEKLVRPYHGKWLRLTGPVRDIGAWHADASFAQVTLQNFCSGDSYVFFHFNDEAIVQNRLSLLNVDTKITIVGKITEIYALGITLSECKLESVHRTTELDSY